MKVSTTAPAARQGAQSGLALLNGSGDGTGKETDRHVDEPQAVPLGGRGVAVRDLLDATNSVSYNHFDPLVAALPEVLEWSIIAGNFGASKS